MGIVAFDESGSMMTLMAIYYDDQSIRPLLRCVDALMIECLHLMGIWKRERESFYSLFMLLECFVVVLVVGE